MIEEIKGMISSHKSPERFETFLKSCKIDMNFVNILFKNRCSSIFKHLGHAPLKIQQYIIGKGEYINSEITLINGIYDQMTEGTYNIYQFNNIYTTDKDKHKIIKKHPRYIKYIINSEVVGTFDIRAREIVARYHSEYYVSNWDFGYEMDLLAIKMKGKKRESVYKKLIVKRNMIHISIQFEYLNTHKVGFAIDEYDLSFNYL